MIIAVFGAKGRVGSKVCEIAKKRNHTVYEIDKGNDVSAYNDTDVVIDFSVAEATEEVCGFCLKNRCPLVTGVTGRTEAQSAMIDKLKKEVRVTEKSNFSQGIAFMKKICEIASRELKNWDCEIVETHRKGKKDAPSGTAKSLATVIAENRGSFSSVTIHAQRLGSCFGRHSVTFAAEGESLTFTHNAENVDIFALGAVKEAEGLMKDARTKTAPTV